MQVGKEKPFGLQPSEKQLCQSPQKSKTGHNRKLITYSDNELAHDNEHFNSDMP